MYGDNNLNTLANAGNQQGGKLGGQVERKFGTLVNPAKVSAFTLVLDNSASATDTLYRLFDADTIVASIRAVAGIPADSGTVDPDVITATTIHSPIVFSKFNYQTSSDVNQFQQKFDILRGEIDGGLNSLPNITAKGKRNTQFDPLLLTVEEPVKIDAQTAIELTVLAGETVSLLFFVVGFTRC